MQRPYDDTRNKDSGSRSLGRVTYNEMRRQGGRASLAVSQMSPGLRPGVIVKGAVGRSSSLTDCLSTDINLVDIRTCTRPGGTPKSSVTLVMCQPHIASYVGLALRMSAQQGEAMKASTMICIHYSLVTVSKLPETAKGEKGLFAHSFNPSRREDVTDEPLLPSCPLEVRQLLVARDQEAGKEGGRSLPQLSLLPSYSVQALGMGCWVHIHVGPCPSVTPLWEDFCHHTHRNALASSLSLNDQADSEDYHHRAPSWPPMTKE